MEWNGLAASCQLCWAIHASNAFILFPTPSLCPFHLTQVCWLFAGSMCKKLFPLALTSQPLIHHRLIDCFCLFLMSCCCWCSSPSLPPAAHLHREREMKAISLEIGERWREREKRLLGSFFGPSSALTSPGDEGPWRETRCLSSRLQV